MAESTAIQALKDTYSTLQSILDTGNTATGVDVGIGVTTPDAKLTIKDNSTTQDTVLSVHADDDAL
jgi:histidine ammonia-lyase